MTVEATLALPLFLFFFLNFIAVFQTLQLQSTMQQALHQTGNALSVQAYAYRQLSQEQKNQVEGVLKEGVSDLYARQQVISWLKKEKVNESILVNGMTGLHFGQSEILRDEKDKIYIQVDYAVKSMFPIMGFPKLQLSDTYLGKAWTGYCLDTMQEAGKQEQYVYITETGTVYHKERNCSYLNLSIYELDPFELENSRNESGERYLSCALCGSVGEQNIVYVTKDGTCYHSNLLCSGIKRSIYAIPISQKENRHCCSRCGGF